MDKLARNFYGLLLVLACIAMVAAFLAVGLGICRLPQDLGWRHIVGAGILGGIGFTMSIFITNLAYSGQADLINESKIAVLLASICAGGAGFLWLRMARNEK